MCRYLRPCSISSAFLWEIVIDSHEPLMTVRAGTHMVLAECTLVRAISGSMKWKYTGVTMCAVHPSGADLRSTAIFTAPPYCSFITISLPSSIVSRYRPPFRTGRQEERSVFMRCFLLRVMSLETEIVERCAESNCMK